MIELAVKGILAYLLGSVVGGLLIGQFRGVDIRTLGSGNAGATNALRTQGKAVALGVLVIDLGKGWLATRVIPPHAIPGIPAAVPELHAWLAAVCGIAVILGHVCPLWYGFRGGKGVATYLGAVLGISPSLALVMVLTWLVMVVLVGFVGLASMTSAVAVAVAIAAGTEIARGPLVAFGVLAALLIIFTHRSNIVRMRAGVEPRAKRLWLFGLRRGQG